MNRINVHVPRYTVPQNKCLELAINKFLIASYFEEIVKSSVLIPT